MIKQIEKILIISGIFLLVAKMLLAGFLFWKNFKNPKIEFLQSYGNAQAEEIINLTNQYRLNHGLNQLLPNPRLTQAAINKAKDILSKGYFNHTSPDGHRFSYWIKESGYPYFYVGENLAMDFNNSEELFNAWIKSERHKENIEKVDFQEIGVASLGGVFNSKKTNIVVQLFGTRILEEKEIINYQNNYQFNLIDSLNNDYKIIDTQKLIFESLTFLNYYLDLTIVIIACLLLFITFVNKKDQFNPISNDN